jgi:hypothetical protein
VWGLGCEGARKWGEQKQDREVRGADFKANAVCPRSLRFSWDKVNNINVIPTIRVRRNLVFLLDQKADYLQGNSSHSEL